MNFFLVFLVPPLEYWKYRPAPLHWDYMVLEIEPWASFILSKHSIKWATTSAPSKRTVLKMKRAYYYSIYTLRLSQADQNTCFSYEWKWHCGNSSRVARVTQWHSDAKAVIALIWTWPAGRPVIYLLLFWYSEHSVLTLCISFCFFLI